MRAARSEAGSPVAMDLQRRRPHTGPAGVRGHACGWPRTPSPAGQGSGSGRQAGADAPGRGATAARSGPRRSPTAAGPAQGPGHGRGATAGHTKRFHLCPQPGSCVAEGPRNACRATPADLRHAVPLRDSPVGHSGAPKLRLRTERRGTLRPRPNLIVWRNFPSATTQTRLADRPAHT